MRGKSNKCIVYPASSTTDNYIELLGMLFEEREYFAIPEGNLKEFTDLGAKYQKLPHWRYRKALNEFSIYSFLMVEVSGGLPVRFVALSREEYDGMELKECKVFSSQWFKLQISRKPNMLLLGQTVSMWSSPGQSYTKKRHQYQIKDCYDIQNSYGLGYGPRQVSYSIVYNIYTGKRRSQLCNTEPFHTREDIPDCTYFRKNYCNPEGRGKIETTLKLVAKLVMTFARQINSNYMDVVGFETCDRIICTLGTTHCRHKFFDNDKIAIVCGVVGTTPSLGFANAPHIDRCDKFNSMQVNEIITHDDELGPDEFRTIRMYCEKIWKYQGMGLPTTCGYHHCGEHPGYNLVAKFGVYGFAMELNHDRVHHMHGWSFSHLTFAPILVNPSCVRLLNEG